MSRLTAFSISIFSTKTKRQWKTLFIIAFNI